MTVTQAVSHIAKYHKEWIKYVQKESMNKMQSKYAEDFVQTCYIKILESKTLDVNKLFNSNNKLNKSYVFKILKNILINDIKKKKINTITNYNWETLHHAEPDKDNKEELLSKMESTIENMYWFDKKLLQLYVYKIPSIRKISKETKIGTKAIFQTLKKCKNIIRTELNEYKKAS
tara:strand:+ start:522 stop:1046 length:525 start_codon:yes stop_codon:yes gene_type:complete